jgi:tetratricopeptide (TPR) repeat protein
MVDALEEKHRYDTDNDNILGNDETWPTVQRIYDAFFTRYPEDIRRRYSYAYHAYMAGKYDIAIEQFEIIGNRWMQENRWSSLRYYNESRAFAYYKRGEHLLWKQRSHQISIDYFRRAIDYSPTAPAYYGLGIAYWYIGNRTKNVSLLEKAEASLETAVQIQPNYNSAKRELKRLRKYLKRLGA